MNIDLRDGGRQCESDVAGVSQGLKLQIPESATIAETAKIGRKPYSAVQSDAWLFAHRSRSVYVVSAGDLVKIGSSGHPAKRIHGIRPINGCRKLLAFAVEYSDKTDALAVEAIAHYLLWGHRVSGEWFRVSVATAKRAVRRANRLLRRNSAFERFPRGLSAVAARGDFDSAIQRFKQRLQSR